ncbi:nucleotidyltransferase family protein [Candidatus Poribacteria bacterium]|nr:nucleotidyltransferase family protein [Candidatus Poribacteria bacterium]
MKAIILAAGKGSRFGDLTKNIPKPLLKINNRPILEYVLSALPMQINEIIIVIGYLANKIKDYFGDYYSGKSICYVNQRNLEGTASALWVTKSYLNNTKEKFLVLNGDDIYQKSDLEHCLLENLAFGVYESELISKYFLTVEINKNGTIKKLQRPSEENQKKVLIATGAYVLDYRIFNCQPMKLKDGEYGLPQTIFKMAEDFPVQAIFMDYWKPVNCLDDLKKAKEVITWKE